jgi:hypothetical protein
VTSDVYRRRELLRRLDDANARVRVQQDVLSGANTVIRVRLTRHVESVTELLTDLDARSIEMPAAHTAERRQFERDLSALEHEIEFVEAKFRAARAEERGDLRAAARADARAAAAQASVLRSEIGPSTERGDGRSRGSL